MFLTNLGLSVNIRNKVKVNNAVNRVNKIKI